MKLKFIFHGQSCMQVVSPQTSIIIDPFLTSNPVAKKKPGDIKVDYILITHAHFDHLEDAGPIAETNNATIIAPFELATYFGWKGFKVHPMHIGGAHQFEFGRVKLTQAFHGSGLKIEEEQRFLYMGMPAGFLITMEGVTFYHAGDTGLFGDMKLIGEQNKIDIAFLPIGDNFTMGPDDALIAAEWLNAKEVVPIHYNGSNRIKQDGAKFIKNLHERGINGRELNVNEEWIF